jgi:hypothetical protein
VIDVTIDTVRAGKSSHEGNGAGGGASPLLLFGCEIPHSFVRSSLGTIASQANMLEVLAKSADPNVPLHEQAYCELRLDDLGYPFQPQFVASLGSIARHRFIVREAHAAWSETDQDIICGRYEHDECSTIEEAELRYELRRAVLVLRGFIYSNMEP